MHDSPKSIAVAMVRGESYKMAADIFFQKLHSVNGYIVYFSNIPAFLFIIIVLSDISSVPMKYPS